MKGPLASLPLSGLSKPLQSLRLVQVVLRGVLPRVRLQRHRHIGLLRLHIVSLLLLMLLLVLAQQTFWVTLVWEWAVPVLSHSVPRLDRLLAT